MTFAGLIVATLLYLIAMIGYQYQVFWKQKPELSLWERIALAGLVAHSMSIGAFLTHFGQLPLNNMGQASALMGWTILSALFIFGRKGKMRSLGAITLPIILVLTSFASYESWNHQDIISPQSPWLWLHVVSIIAGYALFCLAALSAAFYSYHSRLLKQKKHNALSKNLPSLSTLDRLTLRLIGMGFPCILLGLLTGLAVAQWKWTWDPKIVFTAITTLVYAFYLSARLKGWQGKKLNQTLLIAFLLLLISYWIPGEIHPL